jgi:hypothetical protein
MTDAPQADSYDAVCFRILAYEFPEDDRAEAQKKIKRKLKRDGLGAYDQERVDYIRSLKDDLYGEIRLFQKSKYYVGPVGSFADLRDFDFEPMVSDYRKKYSRIGEEDLRSMIGFALYLYYLR